MAEQKLQPGFTPISNNVMERIYQSDFTAREMKIIFAVIRFTAGFHRSEAELSLRFLSKATKIDFRHVQTVVKNLIERNVLIISRSSNGIKSRVIQLNNDYFPDNTSIDQNGDTNISDSIGQNGDATVTDSAKSSIGQDGDKEKKTLNKTLKKTISTLPQIPDELLEIPGFTDLWDNWITHRAEIKKPLKPTAARLQLEKLIDLRNKGSDVVELVSTAIRNSWQGIWEVNNNGGNNNHGGTNNGGNNGNKASVQSRLNYRFDPEKYERERKEYIEKYGGRC